MNDNKCPICGKAGLEDFRNIAITCPACNTDLSVFVLLNKSPKINKFKSLIIACLLCLSAVLLLLINSSYKTQKELKTKLFENTKNIVQLKDSILNVKKQALIEKQAIEDIYTVKRGDSFCRISSRLFGTEIYAKKIAVLNGKFLNDKIYVGAKFKLPKK